jgi:hypothetical protein
MGGGNNSPPAAPDFGKTYQTGIDVMLKNLPALLAAEEAARASTDPARIEAQQKLQDLYGPTQVQQQLDALKQFDPESAAIRADLGKRIQGDLASGYDLPPEYARQIEQSVRGAQAARGNILGTGSIMAESALKGKAALDLYQQHLTNAGNFLAGPTPEQQALAIQGVQPDRSMSYVNPGAGIQGANFGLANYSNLLAQQQLVGGQRNPWQQALTGGATGAATGAAFGPYGALIGGAVGAGVGYFGSDRRLKDRIIDTGRTYNGMRLFEFNYKWSPIRLIGVMADEVEQMRPESVRMVGGFKVVDYDSLGLKMELA